MPLKDIFKDYFLPPVGLWWFVLLGWVLAKRRPQLGRGLIGIAVFALYLLSTPYVAGLLQLSLQRYPALDATLPGQSGQAIVILSCGVHHRAAEFHWHRLSACALERVFYGAYLHRQTGVPILLSGGAGGSTPDERESAITQRVLAENFHTSVQWIENESIDTREGAARSFHILSAAGIRDIYLVTHAWHLPRATWAYEQAGFRVTPAGTAYQRPPSLTPGNFFPTVHSLQQSHIALYEWIGWLWYRVTA